MWLTDCLAPVLDADERRVADDAMTAVLKRVGCDDRRTEWAGLRVSGDLTGRAPNPTESSDDGSACFVPKELLQAPARHRVQELD